jgi:hypothetical protein
VNNKKLLILIVLVTAIWGLIGYKVYIQLREEPIAVHTVSNRFIADTTRREDYTLLLSYQDPFLKKTGKKKTELKTTTIPQTPKKRTTPVTLPPRVMVDWTKIKYLGVMNNTSRQVKTVAIRLDGNDHFVKEGEAIDGFKILEVRPDSVKVGIEGTVKYIKRDNGQ